MPPPPKPSPSATASPPSPTHPPLLRHARKLPLPNTSHAASPVLTLLADPVSGAVAAIFADASALLFHASESFFFPIASPLAASASFLSLSSYPSAAPVAVFLAAAPSLASAHLRAYSLSPSPHSLPISFASSLPAPWVALPGMPFGLGLRMVAAAINVLAVQWLSGGQIWVLAARQRDGGVVDFQKCAVVEIDAARPVYAMAAASGRLVLGEIGGVEVFPLRALIRGNRRSRRGTHGGSNGVIQGNDYAQGKLTTLKVKQNSGHYGSYFVTFSGHDNKFAGTVIGDCLSTKTVSIHSFSKNKLLVLDSDGDLHLFSLPKMEMSQELVTKNSTIFFTKHLQYAMEVQTLAVSPSTSSKTIVIWVSDGGHSVHILSEVDNEPYAGHDGLDDESILPNLEFRALESIFVAEKVKDIILLSKGEFLILGQGNIFLYTMA